MLDSDPYFQIELRRLPVEYYQQSEDIQEVMVVFPRMGSWRLIVYNMDKMRQSHLINHLFPWRFELAVVLFGLETDQLSPAPGLIQSASMQDPYAQMSWECLTHSLPSALKFDYSYMELAERTQNQPYLQWISWST